MKLKQIPEDFLVKELSNISINNKGEYSICLLEKIIGIHFQ